VTAAGTTELEIKVDLLDEASYLRLAAALGRAHGEVLQHNRFYDTPDRDLGHARLALRLRDEADALIVTLKGPGDTRSGATRRLEIEASLDAETGAALRHGQLSLAKLDAAPVAEARRRVEISGLEEVVNFEN